MNLIERHRRKKQSVNWYLKRHKIMRKVVYFHTQELICGPHNIGENLDLVISYDGSDGNFTYILKYGGIKVFEMIKTPSGFLGWHYADFRHPWVKILNESYDRWKERERQQKIDKMVDEINMWELPKDNNQ